MKKIRLDKCLTDHGFFESREQAKKAIMAGLVLIDGVPRTKAGDQIPEDINADSITVKGSVCPYVSRGGFKLEKGLKVFPFDVKGKTVLDIGASTGGFTDCLLQNGANKVYSIDVGYGQLDWRLRQDERVVCIERTNFRYLEKEQLNELGDASVMDVSFISILKLLPKIAELTIPDAYGLWLIKPQFEAGKEKIGKNGVVKEPKTHIEVLKNTTDGIRAAGFSVLGLDYSPIRGPKGNIEFLCFTRKGQHPELENIDERIRTIVSEVHQQNQ